MSSPSSSASNTMEPSWLSGIAISLKTQMATWVVALLVGILGLFSGKITESIRFALNRADLRSTQYEELATEVSDYIFAAELTTEFIEKNWTMKSTLTGLVTDYNAALTQLRKKEFVYSAWVQKYWSTEQTAKFEAFMTALRKYDEAIHLLNDEFEKVNIKGTQDKVAPERAKEALKLLVPYTQELRKVGRSFLVSLN